MDNPGFVCSCNTGYTGDGTVCTEVDTCLGNNCEAGTTCVSIPGSFFCAVLVEPLIEVDAVACSGAAKDSIKTAFNLGSGPINTGSANFGYGNCDNGFGDIKQTYPFGIAASSGGSGRVEKQTYL